jgi:hypothetical protein
MMKDESKLRPVAGIKVPDEEDADDVSDEEHGESKG